MRSQLEPCGAQVVSMVVLLVVADLLYPHSGAFSEGAVVDERSGNLKTE
ncbi:hypothetical protein SAMN04488026_106529 [Aliiruegeria lutimaris]|uniref:Uncharacterized protein n=1 Tax=Aliiruegeria lutimaris TaxID=571298 RepID=A0A1G9GWX7_9RHOB|nr:hypothetical protein SAMN04488026_106529 [Aliiruegeria lutimaris]